MAVREPLEVASNGEPLDDEPFALEAHEFVQLELDPPPPLLGTKRNTLLPVAGLGIIAGKEGIGKTTLVLDLAFHLASGIDWLGWAVPRPVNVLLVENEGPQHAFRVKLREKIEHWERDHRLLGKVYVQNWNWGGLTFSDQETLRRAHDFFEETDADDHHVDVVIGDPLDSLGVEGVGNSDDVRKFVAHLVPFGHKVDRAFVFLHHLAHHSDGAKNELERISGVWGRPADAVITVGTPKRPVPDQIRVHPLKLRWARDKLAPVIAGLIRETSGFERICEEGEERLVEDEIVELLNDGVWRTVPEIAESNLGGIGSKRHTVEQCLKGNYLFTAVGGKEILGTVVGGRAFGTPGKPRSPRATLWQLAANKDNRPEAPIAPESSENGGQADLWQDEPDDVPGARDESGRVDTEEPDPWGDE